MGPRPASLEPSASDSGHEGIAAGARAFERLLRSDPELLRSLVDQAADAVCLHEIDGRILDVNLRMCRTLGYTREELLTLSVLDIDVTATREGTAKVAQGLKPGVPVTAERVLRRKDGATFPIELSLSLIVSGPRRLMLGIARDITDRKLAERTRADAQRVLEERVRERTQHLEIANRRLEEEILARQRSESALRASEAQFRELAERGHMLAWEADATTRRFVYVGPQAVELLGYPIEAWYRPDFWTGHLHPDDRERVVEYCRTQSEHETDYEFEYRMIGADGRTVWLQDIVHVIQNDDKPGRLRGFMIDITARKRAEEARQLLLRELDHRVKNTLSTVQAVVELTLHSSSTMEGFGEMLRGRIAALARMHSAIWRNHGTPIRLRELVELSLAPFGRGNERTVVEGDEVSLPPQTAGALGLALHELATNALKHGALAAAAGRIRVAWNLGDDRLRLDWRESGGPPVSPPTHRGFGSVLIERSIPYELGGRVDLDFAPEGLRCTIAFPLVHRFGGAAKPG
jgi:PAS domain S-box-containing protein